MNKLTQIIIARFKSKNPLLFAKISKWAMVIGLLASIVVMLPLGLPAVVITILNLLLGICAGIYGTSNLTSNNEKILEETNKIIEDQFPD